MPVYRLYNPYATVGTHHYTTSAQERLTMASAGWQTEGIGWYGAATTPSWAEGWQSNTSGTYLGLADGSFARDSWLAVDGKLRHFGPSSQLSQGLQIVDGSYLLFDDEGTPTGGWHEFGGYWYLFSNDGTIRSGWVSDGGSRYYLDPATFERHTGWTQVDGSTYLFGSDGAMLTGWQQVDGTNYYLDPITGARQAGWLQLDGTWYYLNPTSGARLTGWQQVSGNRYYLDPTSGAMLTGWQQVDGNRYYLDPTSGVMLTGWQQIAGSWYYLDPSSGIMQTGVVWDGNTGYVMASDGHWTGETRVPRSLWKKPVYYRQGDSRWGSRTFGGLSMAATGCSPTSSAMAIAGITGNGVTPLDVATYLYNNTSEFNKNGNQGASGLGIRYAAEHWGVACEPVDSTDAITAALNKGKIIVMAVGPGTFVHGNYTHAIVLFDYSNGSAHVYDPETSARNGWYSVSSVWAQRSGDSYDWRGGHVAYALG